MLTVGKRLAAHTLSSALLRRAAQVHLDWATRQKSRFEAHDSLGRHLGVFLPRGLVLRGGDALVASDGSIIQVMAAPETVVRIRPAPQLSPAEQAFALQRAAYHLGNRHVMLALTPQHLVMAPDAVLVDMLQAMGLHCDTLDMPFEPEAGAYGEHRTDHEHGHGHGHGHGHAHAHHGH